MTEPQIRFEEPLLRFDFPGLEIGVAEYDEGPTGCTVLRFPEGAVSAVDVRGGAPGLLGDYGRVDAICLAGGSLYGLEAATGVQAELLAQRGSVAWGKVALVSAAIIFDFGGRANIVYPDKALGAAAWRAARPGLFPQGRRGAGRSASVGKLYEYPGYEREPGGQGAAFRRVGGVRIAVFTVVNSIGVVVDRNGRVVRGLLDPATGARLHPREVVARHQPAEAPPPAGISENTTLTVVATDREMTPFALRQLARQVHSSMARAIQPFHTQRDGDILFAVSTEAVSAGALGDTALAEIASDLAWDAVLAAVAGP